MDKILREIQREDKKNPYTDQELAEMLNVARSEVISVRKKNNILDSRERRKKNINKRYIKNCKWKSSNVWKKNNWNINRKWI